MPRPPQAAASSGEQSGTSFRPNCTDQAWPRSAANGSGCSAEQHPEAKLAILWHKQSLLYQELWWATQFSIGATDSCAPCAGTPAQAVCRRALNRKGLKERLRQKRRIHGAADVNAAAIDVSSSEGHKVWDTSDDSERCAVPEQGSCERIDAAEERIAAVQQQLRASQEAEENLRQRHAELAECLQCETARTDAANDSAESAWQEQQCHKASAEGAEHRAQAAEHHMYELESMVGISQNNVSELEARLREAEIQVQALERKLHMAEVDSGAQFARNAKLREKVHGLETKLQTAEIDSGGHIARHSKLSKKVKDLEAKLHAAEIECGAEIARNAKLHEKLQWLAKKLLTAEIDSGTHIARNAKLSEFVQELCRAQFDSGMHAHVESQDMWLQAMLGSTIEEQLSGVYADSRTEASFPVYSCE